MWVLSDSSLPIRDTIVVNEILGPLCDVEACFARANEKKKGSKSTYSLEDKSQ